MNSRTNETAATPLARTGGRDHGTDVLARPSEPTGSVNGRHTTSVGSLAGLRGLRRSIAGWLGEYGLDEPLYVADVQLVAVEIVTNAFVHSSAGSVDVSIQVADDHVVTTIEHTSPIPTPLQASTALPDDGSVSGRGLFMVDQIARTRTVCHVGGSSVIRLDIDLPSS